MDLKQAATDGSWNSSNYWGEQSAWMKEYDTAYVTRILANDLTHRPADAKDFAVERAAVEKAIAFLQATPAMNGDPYRAAMLALAKLSLKQDAGVEIRRCWLRRIRRGSNCTGQRNTHGLLRMGNAGRVETTALALDVLGSAKLAGNTSAELESALSRGTLFLCCARTVTACGIPRRQR